MRLLILALTPLVAAPEASAQVRKTVKTGDNRVGAFWARNGDTKGLGLDAEIAVYSRMLVVADVVRLDFGPSKGDQVSGGLGWTEATSYGRFTASYSWGKIDDGVERHDRQIGRLSYAYDMGRDWQLEGSLLRFENPVALGGNLTAPRFLLRYNNGGPVSLDLGYSRKDALTGVPGSDDPTWIAGLSLRF